MECQAFAFLNNIYLAPSVV